MTLLVASEVQKCSCPIHWAILPDKSGNYEKLEPFTVIASVFTVIASEAKQSHIPLSLDGRGLRLVLSPSLLVILSVAKNLISLRVNSAKRN